MALKKYKLCFALSVLFTSWFVIDTIVDFINYSNTLNSAPFSLWVIINAVLLIIPAITFLIVGLFQRKKYFLKIKEAS